MLFRSARFLPEELKRVLYLDPDTLVINSLLPLWELELDGHLFAAAAHTGKTEIANNVNRFRLGTEGDYYNSGVLLMDLERCRNEIHTEELFDYVSNHGDELILPDQDILNALYGGRVLAVDPRGRLSDRLQADSHRKNSFRRQPFPREPCCRVLSPSRPQIGGLP